MSTRYQSGFTNQNFTQSVRKSSNYTVTVNDEHLVATSTLTFTLPSIATLLTSGKGRKTYQFETSGAATVMTIAANSADKLNGASSTNMSWTGDAKKVAITADSVRKNWEVVSEQPLLDTDNLLDSAVETAKINNGAVTGAKTSLTKHYPPIFADTSGTDPVTVVTAPVAMTIKGIIVAAVDTVAGNVVLKNGTATVTTLAKSATIDAPTMEAGTLSNTSVAAGAAVTVVSSATNANCRCVVFFEATA